MFEAIEALCGPDSQIDKDTRNVLNTTLAMLPDETLHPMQAVGQAIRICSYLSDSAYLGENQQINKALVEVLRELVPSQKSQILQLGEDTFNADIDSIKVVLESVQSLHEPYRLKFEPVSFTSQHPRLLENIIYFQELQGSNESFIADAKRTEHFGLTIDGQVTLEPVAYLSDAEGAKPELIGLRECIGRKVYDAISASDLDERLQDFLISYCAQTNKAGSYSQHHGMMPILMALKTKFNAGAKTRVSIEVDTKQQQVTVNTSYVIREVKIQNGDDYVTVRSVTEDMPQMCLVTKTIKVSSCKDGSLVLDDLDFRIDDYTEQQEFIRALNDERLLTEKSSAFDVVKGNIDGLRSLNPKELGKPCDFTHSSKEIQSEMTLLQLAALANKDSVINCLLECGALQSELVPCPTSEEAILKQNALEKTAADYSARIGVIIESEGLGDQRNLTLLKNHQIPCREDGCYWSINLLKPYRLEVVESMKVPPRFPRLSNLAKNFEPQADDFKQLGAVKITFMSQKEIAGLESEEKYILWHLFDKGDVDFSPSRDNSYKGVQDYFQNKDIVLTEDAKACQKRFRVSRNASGALQLSVFYCPKTITVTSFVAGCLPSANTKSAGFFKPRPREYTGEDGRPPLHLEFRYEVKDGVITSSVILRDHTCAKIFDRVIPLGNFAELKLVKLKANKESSEDLYASSSSSFQSTVQARTLGKALGPIASSDEDGSVSDDEELNQDEIDKELFGKLKF